MRQFFEWVIARLRLFPIFLVFCSVCYAQEIDKPIICDGDNIEYFDDEKKVVGSGNIVITHGDTKLTCDKVTVYLEKKEAEAEGNVRLTQKGSIFEGEYISYNFEQETGTVLKARGYTDPWYAKGKSAEKDPEKFTTSRGYITTCSHERPHWKISARRVIIYPEKKVVARDGIMWMGGIPVMWVPVYVHPLDDKRPHVTVIPGHSSDWGGYTLTAWRYNLTPNQKGHVRIDYREKKDFASGIDYNYKSYLLGKGSIKTYYTHERDLGRDHIYSDRNKGDPTVEEEKGLFRWRHSWQMFENTNVIAELHKYRDKDFLKDYFFNEYENVYEKDIQPESYVLLSYRQPSYYFSVLTKKRANRFEDMVERLPEAKLDIYNLRLSQSRFYFKGSYSAVNLNRKYPRSTDLAPVANMPIHHNNRYDTYNQLSYVTKLGWLNISPYAGTRQTYFDRGLTDDGFESDSHIRGIFYTGIDTSTKFFKVYQTDASPFGMEINDLRHIITPSVSYNFRPQPTMANSKIFQFDDIDSIGSKNAFTFAFENKLQTKRGEPERNVDLALLLLETDYDFSHTPGTQFLDYKAKLELNPFDWLAIASDVIIDSHKRYHHEWFKESNIDVTAFGKDWNFGVGHRYIKDSHGMIGQLQCKLNPKWRIKIYEDFDFKSVYGGKKREYDLKEQEYVITRDLHCWEMDVRYNVRREGGETIMVIFRLKAFPEIPFQFGKSYHKPKLGSQSYEFTQ